MDAEGECNILTSNKFIASKPVEYIICNNSELLWVAIPLVGCRKLMIGYFYTLPSITNPEYLDEISRTVSNMINTNTHIWLAGDFNIPDIDWHIGAPSQTADNLQQCNRLLAIVNDRSQMIREPTRTDANSSNVLLNLFFTNMPHLVNKQHIISGITDHDIPILVDTDTHVMLNKKRHLKYISIAKVTCPIFPRYNKRVD